MWPSVASWGRQSCPPGPPTLMGSFPHPQGRTLVAVVICGRPAGRSPVSNLEGSVLGARGSPGLGAWTEAGSPHLVAQHPSSLRSASGTRSSAPACCRSVAASADTLVGPEDALGEGRGEEGPGTQRQGPPQRRGGGVQGGTGARSPNSKLARDRDALGSRASHVLPLARGEPPCDPWARLTTG